MLISASKHLQSGVHKLMLFYVIYTGHIYAIGNCGGAMMESKCPECKTVIGGGNHRLADGNRHSSVMDGSRHAAWSEQANLANFDLRGVR